MSSSLFQIVNFHNFRMMRSDADNIVSSAVVIVIHVLM